ncbi:pentatricopeptide repeat-containing protein At4g38010 [Rosa chinensis]|nr:pentatricopeptide repeat-containing protein At4g38010 [Rosa chinensis]
MCMFLWEFPFHHFCPLLKFLSESLSFINLQLAQNEIFIVDTSSTMHSLKWVLLDLIGKCKTLSCFKQIHAKTVTSGLACNELVATNVVNFLGKSVTHFDYACDFLKQVDWRVNSFPFNMLISGYANGENAGEAVLVYRRIVRDGFMPDMFTIPAVLKSCVKFLGMGEGRQVHGVVVKMGFQWDVYVQNSLVHFYSVCGDCGSASKVFDEMRVRDVVSWTGLVSGHVKAGLFGEAVSLFLRMDVKPNVATFVSVVVACGRMGYLNVGKGVHGLILKHSLGMDLVVGNAVVDMYVKCESLCEAKRVFDELPERDIVSWTSLISGYVQCKRPRESLDLFCSMQTMGIEPDKIILSSVLSACASLGALDYGRWVHEYIDRKGIKWDVHIGTAMIDMYSKCGCINMALRTFSELPCGNVSTWNALLGGLAMHGHGHEALKKFEEMTRSGIRPNAVTFLAVLTACCHSGLIDEGRGYFHQMISTPHNLSPRLEHYGCMVDLLCRAGLLVEAQKLINTMPMQPDVLILGALLSACKAKNDAELSQEILDRLLQLEWQDSGVYVLLSNIFAANKRWADATRIRRLMKKRGIQKAPGSSVIEVDGKAHEFLVGDTSHPQNEDIHVVLDILANTSQS